MLHLRGSKPLRSFINHYMENKHMTVVVFTDSNYRENFEEVCQPVTGTFWEDEGGNPAGGSASGPGYNFRWQDGVVKSPEAINGANVVDILESVKQRMEFFNSGKYRCRENSLAITHIEEAIHWCEARIRDRKKRGVLSTMEV